MRRVADPLTLMGADISTADSGTPPIQINPGSIKEDYVYEMPISVHK